MPFPPSDYFALPPKARAGLSATLRAQPGLCAPEQNNRNSFQREEGFVSPPQTLFTFLTSLSLRSPLLLKNQTPPILRDYLAAQQEVDSKHHKGILYKDGRAYDIKAAYDVQGVGDGFGTYLTMFTLGIVPFYSTNNGDVDVVVLNNGRVIYSERLDSRFHTVYGWLGLLSADRHSKEDLMNFNEGSSMESQMIDELENRLSRYLYTKTFRK